MGLGCAIGINLFMRERLQTGEIVEARAIGKVLTDSPVIRKPSFTGSTEVGRLLMAQCAGTIKRLSLELGGNAPFIVFDDADLEAAVEGAMLSKFRNAGQTCVCANRILVQRGVAEEFTRRLVSRVAQLRVGDGTAEGTEIGPMIEEKAIAKFESHIRDVVAKGGRLVHGGRRLGGLFIEPAVVTGVTPDMTVAREEAFGPLAPIFPFGTEEEAIAMANDTIFGLAAYFYSEGFSRSVRVSEALEYGMVGHNTGLISNEVARFGGIKQSAWTAKAVTIRRQPRRGAVRSWAWNLWVCLAAPPISSPVGRSAQRSFDLGIFGIEGTTRPADHVLVLFVMGLARASRNSS